MDKVVRATFPFLLCMIAALMLVTYIPSLTIYPEAERRGRVAELYSRVQSAAVKANSVQEITLGDGKVLKLSDCDSINDDLAKLDCTGLFADVTACRKEADGAVGSPCEKKALSDYAPDGDDDDDDDDDWGDDDDDNDAGDEGTDAGAGPAGADGGAAEGANKDDDLDNWDLDDDAGP